MGFDVFHVRGVFFQTLSVYMDNPTTKPVFLSAIIHNGELHSVQFFLWDQSLLSHNFNSQCHISRKKLSSKLVRFAQRSGLMNTLKQRFESDQTL